MLVDQQPKDSENSVSWLCLYDFSQLNNDEMGVLISRKEEEQPYRDTFKEAQRLIRISDAVRLSAETIAKGEDGDQAPSAANSAPAAEPLSRSVIRVAPRHPAAHTLDKTALLLTAPRQTPNLEGAKFMRDAPMPTLQIRDLPDDVYHGIAAAARAEHRSLSQQAIIELRRALGLIDAAQRRKQVIADLAASGRRIPKEAPTPEAMLREDRERP